jgi:hypothetical protein
MDRPRRAVNRPITYWEEYVVTDTWYTTALVEDVPAGELYAALEDEDFSLDEAEECGEEGDNILSDKCDSSDYGSNDCSDSDSSEGSEGDEEVLGASEGESGSEGSDECSSTGSVQ